MLIVKWLNDRAIVPTQIHSTNVLTSSGSLANIHCSAIELGMKGSATPFILTMTKITSTIPTHQNTCLLGGTIPYSGIVNHVQRGVEIAH